MYYKLRSRQISAELSRNTDRISQTEMKSHDSISKTSICKNFTCMKCALFHAVGVSSVTELSWRYLRITAERQAVSHVYRP